MHRTCICLLAFVFVLFLTGSPQAQENNPIDPPIDVPSSRYEDKPSPLNAGSSFSPLSIEQIRANLPSPPAERFEFLRRQRKITLDAIGEASSQLTALQTRKKYLDRERRPRGFLSELDRPKDRIKADLDQNKAELTEAEKKLTNAKGKPSISQDEIKQLKGEVDSLRDLVSEYQQEFDNYDQLKREEEKRKQEREAAEKATKDEIVRNSEESNRLSQLQLSNHRLLGEIDDMVNQLFIASDASNKFKLNMSIAYSALVGLVIVGFFWIAQSNEEIKKTIFSNESGIQFITMFAIVIAVILFGIIGVLESKELSALLGGLSGYILGKSRAVAPSQGG